LILANLIDLGEFSQVVKIGGRERGCPSIRGLDRAPVVVLD
jgi:hypothetical protein